MHEAMSFIPALYKPDVVVHTNTPAFRRLRQEDREFKVILTYIGVLRFELHELLPLKKINYS